MLQQQQLIFFILFTHKFYTYYHRGVLHCNGLQTFSINKKKHKLS